uniref:hypothetical protein n=1 Tax=Actinomadura roseirufa TaxID=2094049 RepID=UPI001A954959
EPAQAGPPDAGIVNAGEPGEPAEEGEPDLPAAPPPEPTGDPRVDAALARLGDLAGRSVADHVEVFEDVHQRLQEILASAGQDDAAPPPAVSPAPSGGPAPGPRPPGQGARPAFPAALRPGGGA